MRDLAIRVSLRTALLAAVLATPSLEGCTVRTSPPPDPVVRVASAALSSPTVSFTFSLSQDGKTSAGVFKSDQTLVKTLWSGVDYTAGTYTGTWDGTDNDGHLISGNYSIHVLTSHCTYTWEGVVGNTSNPQTGPTIFNPIHTPYSLAFAGNTGYIAFGYNEQLTSQALFGMPATPSTNITGKTNILDAGAMFVKVATDGVNVYWAGGAPDQANPDGGPPLEDGFVMATVAGSAVTEKTFSNGTAVTFGTTYHSVIDHILPIAPGNRATGLAVQKNGSYLFVSRRGQNTISVLDKASGQELAVPPISITGPGDLAVDASDNLWVLLYAPDGTSTVRHYTVTLDNTTGQPKLTLDPSALGGVTKPVALACNNVTGMLIVADGGASQQVKAFNASGTLLWTLGQMGGYSGDGGSSGDPAVPDPASATPPKFDFLDFAPGHPVLESAGPANIAVQPSDGSVWIVDPGDNRTLHYSSTAAYINQLAYVPTTHSTSVDPNDPTRVFANFLEYQVDYPPAPTLWSSWKLVRNWRAGVPITFNGASTQNDHYSFYGNLKYVTKLSNGHTYGFVGTGYHLYELPSTGQLRDLNQAADSQLWSLYADGSLRTIATNGTTETWSQRDPPTFTANDPNWQMAHPVAQTAVALEDPHDVEQPPPSVLFGTANLVPLRAGIMTSGNVIVSYDSLNYPPGTLHSPDHRGWHLGGVKLGGTQWLWKTSRTVPNNYNGAFPADGSFASLNGNPSYYLGGAVMTADRNIFTQFVEKGGANQFNHFYDDGLFVAGFGWLGDNFLNFPAGAATDGYTAWMVKLADGRAYIYHGDAGEHDGIHRWRIDNLSSVAELPPIAISAPSSQAGLQADYFQTPDWNSRNSVTTRVDPQVSFSWGTTPPPGTDLTSNQFSARWTGYVLPPLTATYTFKVNADDLARVWVDGQMVVGGSASPTIPLVAGTYYPIRVDYRHGSGAAAVELRWSALPALAEQVIPSTSLACVPGAGASNPGDLLSGLTSDVNVFNGTSGDYGWSWTTPPAGGAADDQWSALTNKRTVDRSPPVDLGLYFLQTPTQVTNMTRDLGTPTDATAQWEIAGRLDYQETFFNQSPLDGQFLQVLDDAGAVIAQIYPYSVAFNSDNDVFAQTDPTAAPTAIVGGLWQVLYPLIWQWQPFRISAQNGQVSFQYAGYSTAPLTVPPGVHWNRPSKLRLQFSKGPVQRYLWAIALDDLTFTTASAAIVSDDFTASDGTQLVGRTLPLADLPADVYARSGAAGWSTLVQNNVAALNADVGVSVSIDSAGSYARPTTLNISANLNPQATTGTQGFRGVGLGYFSTPGGGNGFTGFSGLALNPNGNLTLIENGVAGASVAYAGTWTQNQMHALSYTIDTRSGAISNVLLDGQSKSYTTVAFTAAATKRAGFYVSGAIGGQIGLVDDFVVTGAATLSPCAQPAVSPPGGTYTSPQAVTITTTTSGATIRYTTDGSSPITGALYIGPITINATASLRAIAYKAGMGNSTELNTTYTILALPSPWITQDIGSPGVPGMAGVSGGTSYVVIGSGTDIGGTSDQFRYLYQPATGDCEIRARVAAVQNVNSSTKVGVMIRETLAAGARNAAVLVTPSAGVRAQRRTSTNGSTTSSSTTGLTAPYWVRVVRTGNSFTLSRSADGTTWTTMATQAITMATSVFIGLATTSDVNTTLAAGTLDTLTATP